MRVLFTTVLFATISFSMCCRYVENTPKPYLEDCKDWWSYIQKDSPSDNDIVRCITLIKDKCSDFLVSERDISQEVRRYSIKWKITGRASLASNVHESTHYSVTKRTDVCKGDDEGLGNCHFWWDAAVKLEGTDHIVDRCYKLIKDKCPDKLKITYENREKGLFGKVEHVTLSFKYDGHGPVTFTRCE